MQTLQAEQPPGITNSTAQLLLNKLNDADADAKKKALFYEIAALEECKQNLYLLLKDNPAFASEIIHLILQQQELLVIAKGGI